MPLLRPWGRGWAWLVDRRVRAAECCSHEWARFRVLGTVPRCSQGVFTEVPESVPHSPFPDGWEALEADEGSLSHFCLSFKRV